MNTNKQDDEGMTKYAVDERQDNGALEKAASGGCPEPDCGRVVERHGSVVVCPKHGTAPFEKKR